MDDREKGEFAKVLRTTLDLYGKATTGESIALWWALLAPYPLQAVKVALGDHCRESKFSPTPADVIAMLRAADGRLSADEAWAIAIDAKDEAATVVWTDEMRDAFHEAAQPLLENGDKVAARMAFVEAYRRLVAAARRQGKEQHWNISLGDDKQGRVHAVTRAVEAGRIESRMARHYLPAPEPTAEGLALLGWPQPEAMPDRVASKKAQEQPEKRLSTAELKAIHNTKVTEFCENRSAGADQNPQQGRSNGAGDV